MDILNSFAMQVGAVGVMLVLLVLFFIGAIKFFKKTLVDVTERKEETETKFRDYVIENAKIAEFATKEYMAILKEMIVLKKEYNSLLIKEFEKLNETNIKRLEK